MVKSEYCPVSRILPLHSANLRFRLWEALCLNDIVMSSEDSKEDVDEDEDIVTKMRQRVPGLSSESWCQG